MAKIVMSEEAARDLVQIGSYLNEHYKSPRTARDTIQKIKNRMNELESFPYIGKPLSALIDFETDYRFLGCGGYLVFYRTHNRDVFIDRIFHARQDYISILIDEFQ